MERPPPFGNQSVSVIHRFDRQRRLAQDDVERRKVEAMKAMRAKHDKARMMVASRVRLRCINHVTLYEYLHSSFFAPLILFMEG